MIVLDTKCTCFVCNFVQKLQWLPLGFGASFLNFLRTLSFFWLFDNVLLSVLIFFFIFRKFDLFWWAIISFIFSCMLPNSPSLG